MVDITSLLSLLTDPKILAVVAPLLVSAVKSITDKLPKWATPLLSVVLGSIVSALAGGDPTTGAVAGLAGVGVREVVDQTKKTVAPAK